MDTSRNNPAQRGDPKEHIFLRLFFGNSKIRIFRKSGDRALLHAALEGESPSPLHRPLPAPPPSHQASFGFFFQCCLRCYWHNILSVQLITSTWSVKDTLIVSESQRPCHASHCSQEASSQCLSYKEVRWTTLGNLLASQTLLLAQTGAWPHLHTLSHEETLFHAF